MAHATYVEREETDVLRLRAHVTARGPADAMRALESRLPSPVGREFYGTSQWLPEGEEYYACVRRIPSDDPRLMGLEAGTIPGGLYACRTIRNWQTMTADGRLGRIFDVMVLEFRIDMSRPYVEYYRGAAELLFLFPVLSREPPLP